MILLDLFCGVGGCSAGYYRAGFKVVGVDLHPQPRYPYEFIQSDAMEFLKGDLSRFVAIHASPPCQGYTELRHAPGTKGAPRLISVVRDRLRAIGKPYVIENVPGAKAWMESPVVVCGTAFNLEYGLHQLRRHRLFEANFPIRGTECRHDSSRPVVGVYGGHARVRSKRHGGRGTQDYWAEGHVKVCREVMGMGWANAMEISQAVPPAYTEFIGRQILEHIRNLNG